MPSDPLENPIAFLTDHPVLAADAEAALLAKLARSAFAMMRVGAVVQETFRRDLPPADATVLHQIALGEEARATLARHNLRLVVSIAKRYLRVAGPHLTLEDLISFGSIGLLQGIDRFDPRKRGASSISRCMSTSVSGSSVVPAAGWPSSLAVSPQPRRR